MVILSIILVLLRRSFHNRESVFGVIEFIHEFTYLSNLFFDLPRLDLPLFLPMCASTQDSETMHIFPSLFIPYCLCSHGEKGPLALYRRSHKICSFTTGDRERVQRLSTPPMTANHYQMLIRLVMYRASLIQQFKRHLGTLGSNLTTSKVSIVKFCIK